MHPELGIPNGEIILAGITGSFAYGLDTETSDEDIKGIFVAPTSEILGIYTVRETYDHVDPDWSYHEAGKFIKLAMACNPTILEILFLSGYRSLTKQGRMLVDNRHLFLSNRIRHSYGGYVFSQARKLNARGDSYDSATKNRYEKHTRHLFRLLQQGRELLETGTLTVRVPNRDELFAYGKLQPQEVINLFSEKIKEFDSIKSILPDEPDKENINRLLLKIRKGSW